MATLSTDQSAALFDILSHYNTYAEIRDFRAPGSLDHYGPPFEFSAKEPSATPSLQNLTAKFLMTLPGLRDVPESIWRVQIKQMIDGLERANLSESYDKGAIGTRMTLATANAVVLEYVVRGTTGGFPKVSDSSSEYDLKSSRDLSRAFRNFMDGIIYGNLPDELVAQISKSDQLTDHTPLVQAFHEFALVNIASFMHFILVVSPQGQYILNLMASANTLVPYMAIRQTLKIGNVATMMSGMMKVVLAKLSVTSVTNWMGLTSNADDGLNLMQQIISTVLKWDIRDFEGRMKKIKSNRASPSKGQLRCLDAYAEKSMAEQETIRTLSKDRSISIVTAILATASESADMTEETHKLALEYLAAVLSIRDRKEIVGVFCKSVPDNLTTTVRVIVDAYEPVIRHIHNAVNLSEAMGDLQAFIGDMLKVAKVRPATKKDVEVVPTVGDFVQLLRKHQYSLHKFLNQLCKNGTDLLGWYLEWAKTAATEFRSETSASSRLEAAGKLTEALEEMFGRLPAETQTEILPILDRRSKYLKEMQSISQARLETVLRSPPSQNPVLVKVFASASKSSQPPSRDPSPPGTSLEGQVPTTAADCGPGEYLARWQDLLAHMPLTALTLDGGVSVANPGTTQEGKTRDPMDVQLVTEELGPAFRQLLGQKGLYW